MKRDALIYAILQENEGIESQIFKGAGNEYSRNLNLTCFNMH
jgi:hypothetical protein